MNMIDNRAEFCHGNHIMEGPMCPAMIEKWNQEKQKRSERYD
jgi:hypothetical protein